MENEIVKETETPKKAEAVKGNEPNIIFCRRIERKGEMVNADPPPFIVIPVGEKIKLPSPADQLKGFYHERAADIIREMPKSYKRFEKKGAK